MSKFNKNAVYSGVIDYYCLVCEEYMKTVDDVEVHINIQDHEKKLKAAHMHMKEDFIRKVDAGYYCELCNQLYTSRTRVKIHVADAGHISNKSLIKRDGNLILIRNEIPIDEKTWNSFTDKTCLMCDEDFDDETKHQNDKKHILNLIQSKIEFRDTAAFRKINDNFFQCLTCNDAVDSAHFELKVHTKKYENSRITIIPTTTEQKRNKKQTDTITEQKGNEKKTDTTTDVQGNEKKTDPITEQKGNEKKTDTTTDEQGNEKKTDTTTDEQGNEKKTDTATDEQGNEKKTDTITDQKRNEKQTNEHKNGTKTKEIVNKKKINEHVEKMYADIDQDICNKLGAKNYILCSDNKNWCLICDWILEANVVASHLKSYHHTTLLKLHKERMEKETHTQAELDIKNTNNKDSTVDPTKQSIDPVSDDLMDSIMYFEQSGVKINLEMRTAYCSRCSDNLDFQYKIIKSHLEGHKTNKSLNTEHKDSNSDNQHKVTKTKKSKGKENKDDKLEDVQRFAKNNALILKNNKYYCSICSESLNISLKVLQDHITGDAHSKSIQRQTKLNTSAKSSLQDFINIVDVFENLFTKDIVINEKYCINTFSFLLYTKCGNNLKCVLCDEQFSVDKSKFHRLTHLSKFQSLCVLTSLDDEFVIEIRPNVLHCGYCNLVIGEDTLSNHLNSTLHEESKRSANNRLEMYLPEIMQIHNEHAPRMTLMDLFKNNIPL